MRPSVRDPAAVPGRRGSPCEVASSERDCRRRVRTPPAAESEARPGCEEEEQEEAEVGQEKRQEEKEGRREVGRIDERCDFSSLDVHTHIVTGDDCVCACSLCAELS